MPVYLADARFAPPQRPLDNRRPAVHDAPPAEPQHEVLIQQLLEPLLLAVGQKRARVVVPNNGPNGSAKGPQALAQRGRIVGIQEQVAAEQRMQLKAPHAVPLAQKLRPGNEASGKDGGIYQLEAGASSRLFGTVTRKGDTASRTRASLKRPPPVWLYAVAAESPSWCRPRHRFLARNEMPPRPMIVTLNGTDGSIIISQRTKGFKPPTPYILKSAFAAGQSTEKKGKRTTEVTRGERRGRETGKRS